MENYLVKIYYLGRVIGTIVENNIELVKLIQLVVDSNSYKLMSVRNINYEPIEDLMVNIKENIRPKDLNFGNDTVIT